MMKEFLSTIFPINPDGFKFIFCFGVVTLMLFFIATPLGWFGVILTLWCVLFFRDPVRVVPQNEGLFVSPADGIVNVIEEATPPQELGLGTDVRMCISIFLNVFNCHINRMPHRGKIKKSLYKTGKFLSADVDKASDVNERHSFLLELPDGRDLIVVQIAGFIARRIVSWSKEGDSVETGERFGLIRFGSRVDVYLPAGIVPSVAVGQTVIGGETILANLQFGDVTLITKEV